MTLPDTRSSSVVRALCHEAFPDLTGRRTLLMAGEDHDTWAVGDAVVKFPKGKAHAANLQRECAVYPTLSSRLGTVVPEILAVADRVGGFPYPIVAFARASGRQGQAGDGPMIQPKAWGRAALARQTASMLSALHATPLRPLSGAGVPSREHDLEAGVDVGAGAVEWADRVAGASVDRFLADPIPDGVGSPGKAVLCHGDLKGEHVFVSEDGTRVTAVIDWADMAIADPAVDLAGLAIWLGPSFVAEVLTHYTGPADEGTYDRAVYLARAGLLRFLDSQLTGGERAPVPLLDAQIRAAFSDQ